MIGHVFPIGSIINQDYLILYQIVQINFVRCFYPFLSTYSQPDHLGFRLPILSDPPKFSVSDIGTTCLIPTPEAAATVLLHADYNLPVLSCQSIDIHRLVFSY